MRQSLILLTALVWAVTACGQASTSVRSDGGGQIAPSSLRSDVVEARVAPLRVMTFNIRLNLPSDSLNAWPHRKEMVAGMIRLHGADVVGMQEVLLEQLEDLKERLSEFAHVGVGRADGITGGEFSPIFYRTDRFELLEGDTFWLSETPEVPGSRSWDTAIERIATWARLRDRFTGDTLFHMNTHYDHLGAQARAESSKLILRRIDSLSAGHPTILIGDFNAPEGSRPYDVIVSGNDSIGTDLRLDDAFYASLRPHHGPTSTWNNFGELEPGRRIDFIFVDDRVEVLQHAILSDRWDEGRWPSDHLPVLAEIRVR